MAAITQWRNYTKQLVTSMSHPGLQTTSHVSTQREFEKRVNNAIANDQPVVWADTENIFTTVLTPTDRLSPSKHIHTALTILRKSKMNDDFDAEEAIYDDCETLLNKFIRKMEEDAENSPRDCTIPLLFINSTRIVIRRDGPYANNFIGVTAQLELIFR